MKATIKSSAEGIAAVMEIKICGKEHEFRAYARWDNARAHV